MENSNGERTKSHLPMHIGNDFQILICHAEVSGHRPMAGRGDGLALVSNTCVFVVEVCD